MLYRSQEEFWWNNITGAHAVVEQVAMALLENKTVVLQVPSDLPWRYSMRSAIQSVFNERTNSRDIIIEMIDARDDNPAGLDPGHFILQRFAAGSVAAGYREKGRISIQDYISQREVIKNRIVWIKGLDKVSAEMWLQFCRGFSHNSSSKELFVLELQGKIPVTGSKYIACVDFDRLVSSYDVQQFNSFSLDHIGKYSAKWKQYISTVTASVCGTDAELSERLLHLIDYRTETAVDGLRRILESGDFDRRGMKNDSNHPLWYYRSGDTAELLHRIWIAQVQVLFPIIELERQQIISKWEESIQSALHNYDVVQYGNILKDPVEVELGTLCFMMSNKVCEDSRMLYIPDEDDRRRIRFLHSCRNKIAHAVCCSPEEVVVLLD